MLPDLSFDQWFDLFLDKCRSLGYQGPIDKSSFEDDWEQEESPESSAEKFVAEVTESDEMFQRQFS